MDATTIILQVWALGIQDLLNAGAKRQWRSDVAAQERDAIDNAEANAVATRAVAVTVAALVGLAVVYTLVT